jgi:hypothetical protein
MSSALISYQVNIKSDYGDIELNVSKNAGSETMITLSQNGVTISLSYSDLILVGSHADKFEAMAMK